MLNQLEFWDNLAESRELLADKWRERYKIEDELENIYAMEAIYWQQRSGCEWILKGDNNTKYFQLIANGRRRKSFIKSLDTDWKISNGTIIYFRKLSNGDWKMIEQRFEKKLSSWKGKHLSVGGRLVLINSVLTSLAMFMVSFLEVPRGVLEKLEYYRSRFFWQADNHKRKYRLTKWDIILPTKGPRRVRRVEY